MPRSDAPPEAIARRLARLVFYAIAFLSFGNFDMALFGLGSTLPNNPMHADAATSLQQYLIFALWLIVIALSYLPQVLRSRPHTSGLAWLMAFYAYAAISALWCSDPLHSVPKAAVFLTCSFGAWRLVSVLTLEEFIDIVRRSLFALMLCCAAALLLNPVHAVTHDWMHEGDWKGMFQQKQELGITAAYLLFLGLMRVLSRFRWIDALGVLLALAMVAGSGSRGGAIIAILAPFAIIVARRSGRMIQAFAAVLVAELCVVIAALGYLAWTGATAIHLGDLTLNVTERTYIWSYALSHWQYRPWLGFGLNGFWTNPQNIWDFARVYHWVLNDYHSGYLAIVVQTGVIGLILFLAVVQHLCSDLRRLLQRLPGRQPPLECAVGLLIMLFTIDMTETIFLRSTNFGQCMFSFLAIGIFTAAHPWPVRRVAPIAATAD